MTELPNIIIATSNAGKLLEIRAGLELLPVMLLSLQDFPGTPEAPEEGNSFEEIARSKAAFYHQHLQMPVLAEDSGLLVSALHGYPGIHSARIAPTDAARIRLILDQLAEKKDRSAFYHCSMVFLTSAVKLESHGRCEGEIVQTPRGTLGFGYDPIFRPEHADRTFAEMNPREKGAYSHRGRALENLLPGLREWVRNPS